MADVNAIIESASIGFEGHGILTMAISFDFGDSSFQSMPAWNLDAPNGSRYIRRVLEVVEVDDVRKLVGKVVRIRRTEGSWSGPIESLGNAFKDRWFTPAEEFQ